MKAVVKTKPEKGLELLDIPIPVPGPEEVLIKVEAASICRTDLRLYSWDKWAQKRIRKFPLVVGREFAGCVAETGRDVRQIKTGDHVSAETNIFCGKCPVCAEGNQHLCENMEIFGIDRNGCLAEYAVLPEKVVWKNSLFFPADVLSVQELIGSAVYCVSAGNNGLVYKKSIAIFGDNPAGLFAAMVAKIYGAIPVILVGAEEYRLSLAKNLGIDAISTKHINPVRYIKSKTNEAGADIVLEMSGDRRAVRGSLEAVKRGGRISAFGILADPGDSVLMRRSDWNNIVFCGINICGIHGRQIFYSWNEVRNILEAELLSIGSIRSVITHKFSLRRFAEAFEIAVSKKCGKIILYPEIKYMLI